jgi:hypothetical protein
MGMTYKEITRTLTSLETYVRSGVFYSEPVIGLFGDKIVDCFFLYSYNAETNVMYPPYGRIAVDSENKTPVYYYHIKEKPFKNSLPENFVSTVSREEEYKKGRRSYESCYEQIRRFAFKTELPQEHKAVLMEYWRAFNVVIDRELKPFYAELSPEFWKWLKETCFMEEQ